MMTHVFACSEFVTTCRPLDIHCMQTSLLRVSFLCNSLVLWYKVAGRGKGL